METIHGTVERITYHTEDTGYTVVKLRVGSRVDPITRHWQSPHNQRRRRLGGGG